MPFAILSIGPDEIEPRWHTRTHTECSYNNASDKNEWNEWISFHIRNAARLLHMQPKHPSSVIIKTCDKNHLTLFEIRYAPFSVVYSINTRQLIWCRLNRCITTFYLFFGFCFLFPVPSIHRFPFHSPECRRWKVSKRERNCVADNFLQIKHNPSIHPSMEEEDSNKKRWRRLPPQMNIEIDESSLIVKLSSFKQTEQGAKHKLRNREKKIIYFQFDVTHKITSMSSRSTWMDINNRSKRMKVKPKTKRRTGETKNRIKYGNEKYRNNLSV